MPAPYLIGDERAIADFLTNTASQPVTAQTLTVTGATTLQGAVTTTGALTQTVGGVGLALDYRASTVAASAAINTTETVLLAMTIAAGTTLIAGSKIRITLEGTCTTTAANTSNFVVRAGTLGTTADAGVVTYTTAAAGTTGTAIPFRAGIELTVQSLGASASAFGSMTYVANAATGLVGAVTNVVPGSFGTFNSTTATRLSVTYASAATTTTTTFQDVSIEIIS